MASRHTPPTTDQERRMNRTHFRLSSIAPRAAALAAATAVSLSLLAAVSQTADQQYGSVLAAQSISTNTAPLQIVVITGKRLPRA
jgi:hypothetical protein